MFDAYFLIAPTGYMQNKHEEHFWGSPRSSSNYIKRCLHVFDTTKEREQPYCLPWTVAPYV